MRKLILFYGLLICMGCYTPMPEEEEISIRERSKTMAAKWLEKHNFEGTFTCNVLYNPYTCEVFISDPKSSFWLRCNHQDCVIREE